MTVEQLTRNAATVAPEAGLEAKLKLGRPLRVKLGIDVTAPDVTLGNGVPLQRMRAFQDAGHIGVLIVGDYTTRIGDPSGRSEKRPMIDPAVIDANAQRYFEHASTIIDPERTELRMNSEWLAKLDFAELLRLARTTTVARLLERDDFAKRFAANAPISVSELLYPLMQAYDSVAVEADVELGGTDQLFNLLTGREVMQEYGLEPQVALTVHYLDSWDGTGMSASRGNYIGLKEAPEEQFGKAMRIPDSLLEQWWTLVAEQPVPPGVGRRGCAGRRGQLHPRRPPPRGARRGAGARDRRRRSGAPAEADRRGGPRRLDERGATPHRPGRREAERRARHGARPAARFAQRCAPAGRQAPLRSFDSLGRTARILRPSERTAQESPQPRP
jgi:tRNA synthetases class I (W and Y)